MLKLRFSITLGSGYCAEVVIQSKSWRTPILFCNTVSTRKNTFESSGSSRYRHRQNHYPGSLVPLEKMQLENRDALKLQEREHNKVLVNSATEPDMHADTIEELKDIHLKLEATAAAIQRKSELLGVRDRARLTKLTNDPFYAARVNALAVKTRLRDRLRARKFEMERVERSFRKQ
ncbi:hypothetical protein H0H92_015782, partial [Tricholoma furcatifolium]